MQCGRIESIDHMHQRALLLTLKLCIGSDVYALGMSLAAITMGVPLVARTDSKDRRTLTFSRKGIRAQLLDFFGKTIPCLAVEHYRQALVDVLNLTGMFYNVRRTLSHLYTLVFE